jgi:DeoR/GlpR family transcriptional regulator of sugar metabolism
MVDGEKMSTMDSIAEQYSNFSQSERQAWITEYILEQGSVLVDDLAERFQVSRMTIHRDLDDLERQGVLRKIRNGATAQPSNLFESDVRFRLARQTKEKEAIAHLTITYIEPGQSIFLDEATTLLPLARMLPSVAPLTVITNFLPIMNELRPYKEIKLIGLGGQYLPRFDTFTGPLCLQTINNLHADCYITSTTAVQGTTAYHPDPFVLHVKRSMIAHTDNHFLLLDHTKFEKTGLYKFAELNEFNKVLVDSGLNESLRGDLYDAGVSLEIASVQDF